MCVCVCVCEGEGEGEEGGGAVWFVCMTELIYQQPRDRCDRLAHIMMTQHDNVNNGRPRSPFLK